jgi:Protein of unknown function (DUF3225)
MSNDVAMLDAMFHEDIRTVRYGGAENLHGFVEIKAFRAGRSLAGLAHIRARLRRYVDTVSPFYCRGRTTDAGMGALATRLARRRCARQ